MWLEEVKCPHCGNVEEEWYELMPISEDKNDIQCGWCEEVFYVRVKATYEFEMSKWVEL